jgi:hypothetical protein
MIRERKAQMAVFGRLTKRQLEHLVFQGMAEMLAQSALDSCDPIDSVGVYQLLSLIYGEPQSSDDLDYSDLKVKIDSAAQAAYITIDRPSDDCAAQLFAHRLRRTIGAAEKLPSGWSVQIEFSGNRAEVSQERLQITEWR